MAVEIKKKTLTTVMFDGTEIEEGKTYIFESHGVWHYGKFTGITNKGALAFEYKGKTYSVMPKSINEIEESEVTQ